MQKIIDLSIVIPAFNEEKTLEQLTNKVIQILALSPSIDYEIIIVNDGSKDKTHEVGKKLESQNKNIHFFENEKNSGKSQTVKNGIAKTIGKYVIIQDADLEYDPQDLVKMYTYAVQNKTDVVYGNRFNGNNEIKYLSFFMGNQAVSMFSNIFTFPRILTWIPDMEVCYKLMRGDVARAIGANITSTTTFGIEPEITARLARFKIVGKRLTFKVIPISYKPRTIIEGKKIRWIDGLKALKEIIHFNLF